MNKKLLLLSAFLAGASWTVLAQDLVLSEGQYYTDETQTTPYTGRYTEFYEDGMLKMELYLKDGRPEGTYVIYYPDGKIAEVRSYYCLLYTSDTLFSTRLRMRYSFSSSSC